MAMTYIYDAETKTVKTSATGSITSAELLDYLQDVTGNLNIEAGFVEIVDFSEAKDLVIKYSETQIFKRVWKSYMEKGCQATIIYAPTDVCFGISRMVQAVISSVEDFQPESFQVVRTEDQFKYLLDEIRCRK